MPNMKTSTRVHKIGNQKTLNRVKKNGQRFRYPELSLTGTPNAERQQRENPGTKNDSNMPPFLPPTELFFVVTACIAREKNETKRMRDRIPVSRIIEKRHRHQELRAPEEVGKPRGGGAEQEQGHAAARELSVQPREGDPPKRTPLFRSPLKYGML